MRIGIERRVTIGAHAVSAEGVHERDTALTPPEDNDRRKKAVSGAFGAL